MFKITYDSVPKVAKDLPWIILMHPSFKSVSNMDDLLKNRRKLNDALTMIHAEPEAFQLLEWFEEYASIIGIDAGGFRVFDDSPKFTIFINPKKIPETFANAEHFMSDTMHDDLKAAFIKNKTIQL